MKMFIKLLLIASLGVASLAASNTYMTSVEDLAVGHVLAEDVTFAEIVVKGGAPALHETTYAAGTALGPAEIARLQGTKLVAADLELPEISDEAPTLEGIEYITIDSVVCYNELGANSGASGAVAVAELVPGQVLGMNAESEWTSTEDGVPHRHTRVVVPSDTVVSNTVIATLNSGVNDGMITEALNAPEVAAALGMDDVAAAAEAFATDALSRTQIIDAATDAGILSNIEPVSSVRVNDFRFEQWQWKWWFVIGCVGMLVAAMLARKTAPKGGASEEAGYTYESTAAHLREVADGLQATWDAAQAAGSPEDRCREIVKHLDDIKAGPLFETTEGLGAFKTRSGYGHYANIVDGFAYGERQLYRAWSSAVDGVQDEAMICLQRSMQAMQAAADLTK